MGPFGRRCARSALRTWSDDGALALSLLASLLDCGKVDAGDFGERLVGWYERGDYAVGRRVSAHRQELEQAICPDDLSPGRGTGYVVDCLRSARWAVDQGGYEQVVKSAVALGYDTDTTACVAGGIAGLRDGVDGIPARFLEALGGKEIATPLIERLVAHAARAQNA